jgi:hypothetical protein
MFGESADSAAFSTFENGSEAGSDMLVDTMPPVKMPTKSNAPAVNVFLRVRARFSSGDTYRHEFRFLVSGDRPFIGPI